MKHKHCDLIVAWANGAKIEARVPGNPNWHDSSNPQWVAAVEYRVKPKPDLTPQAIGVAKYDGEVTWEGNHPPMGTILYALKPAEVLK